ncbi:Ehd1, partial [Symbiodinium microadriaticum]
MRVIEELKRIYKSKIMPLEKLYQYDIFHSPIMTDAEFDSKPQVMLIGQYSVGKTSFIRYLLGKDFPGVRIGPEPTTDRFTAVMDGPDERVIPGNALAVSSDLPYRGLEQFGVAFLNRFEGSQLPSQVLRNITLIDTPGVLSGEKQRVSRGYDFQKVCTWFANRADLIILLFDTHKLDISDEFRGVIEGLKGNEDKIRCILNKADQVDRQKLMRVYGALMWSIGKVMKTPEVLRVYVGSFWSEPMMYSDNAELFEMEEADLMKDLRALPRNSAVRKINELVKRVRLAKVHAYVIGYLREQMPMFMGREKKQKQ